MSAINTLTQNRVLRTTIKDLTSELGRVQEQMNTGLKARTFADHGATDSRKVISLRNEMHQIDSYTRGITRLDMVAERADLSLGQIGGRTAAVKELSIKLAGKLATATDVSAKASDAFSDAYAALTADVSGRFVFSGTEANRSPLVPLDTLKSGIQNAIDAATPAGDPAAVMNAVNTFFADETNWYQGGTAANGVGIARNRTAQTAVLANDPGVRDTLAGLAAMAFGRMATTEDGYAAVVSRANTFLTSGATALGTAIGRNGALRSDLESVKDGHAQVKAYVETQLTSIEEVDVYEASAKVLALKAQLEASYTVTGQLQQLSLTNYLR